jgi:hypothetical protein
MFSAFFRDPELTRQLLSQLLPKAPTATPGVPRKSRVQEALAAKKHNDPVKPKEDELKFDAAMSASDRERLQQADFQSLSASEFNSVEKLARRVKLPLPQIQGRRTRAGGRGEAHTLGQNHANGRAPRWRCFAPAPHAAQTPSPALAHLGRHFGLDRTLMPVRCWPFCTKPPEARRVKCSRIRHRPDRPQPRLQTARHRRHAGLGQPSN